MKASTDDVLAAGAARSAAAAAPLAEATHSDREIATPTPPSLDAVAAPEHCGASSAIATIHGALDIAQGSRDVQPTQSPTQAAAGTVCGVDADCVEVPDHLQAHLRDWAEYALSPLQQGLVLTC